MKLYGALILFLTVSTAYGLKCYLCGVDDPNNCKDYITCPASMNRCFTTKADGFTIKGCTNSAVCFGPYTCCEGDLCNSAIPTGPSVILMLISSAIITLFL